MYTLGKFPALSKQWTCLSLPQHPHVSYIGDCEISVELQKIHAGVNGIQVGETQPLVWAQGRGSQLLLEQQQRW